MAGEEVMDRWREGHWAECGRNRKVKGGLRPESLALELWTLCKDTR